MKNEYGFILIVMLLFLLVLNLLTLCILDVDLLETKMLVGYQDKIKTFYRAENILVQAEQEILDGKAVTVPGVDVQLINSSICGIIFYRLTVKASYRGAESILQSILAKIGEVSRCQPQPKIVPGRQSFLVNG